MGKNRLFSIFQQMEHVQRSHHVYPNMLLQPSMFMRLEEASADECTSVYMSVSACPDKNATTEIMGLFMGNGADASHKYSEA